MKKLGFDFTPVKVTHQLTFQDTMQEDQSEEYGTVYYTPNACHAVKLTRNALEDQMDADILPVVENDGYDSDADPLYENVGETNSSDSDDNELNSNDSDERIQNSVTHVGNMNQKTKQDLKS